MLAAISDPNQEELYKQSIIRVASDAIKYMQGACCVVSIQNIFRE